MIGVLLIDEHRRIIHPQIDLWYFFSLRVRIIGERERANLVVQLARFFCIYIYLPSRCISRFYDLLRLYRKSLQFHVHRVSRMHKYIPFALRIRAHGTTAAASLRVVGGIGLRFTGYTAVLCTTAVH